jgi:hypothetical protein
MALKRWIGAADAVAQITTVTFSTYSSAETYTLTVNGKDISFTSVSGTNSEIWAGLQAAWEDSALPEVIEAIATVASGVVLTSRTPGQPFTVTAGATTGTATVTATLAATGPNFFNNGDNWEGGAAPSAADDILFAENDVDCLYALSPAFAIGEITIDQSYTGKIGLARTADAGYQEYRSRYFTLNDAAVISIGSGLGNGSSRILIDAATETVTVDVYSSGQGEGFERPVQIRNAGSSSEISVYGGRVDISGTGGSALLNVIGREGSAVPAEVTVAEGVDVSVVVVAGNNTTLRLAGEATSIDASGAVVYWDSTVDITTKLFVFSQGTASFARRKQPRAVAACELHAGGTLIDSFETVTWTTGIVLVGLVSQVTLDVGRNPTLDIS